MRPHPTNTGRPHDTVDRMAANREIVRERIEVEVHEEYDALRVYRDPVTGMEEIGEVGEDHARKHLIHRVQNQMCLGYGCERIFDDKTLYCSDCNPHACCGEGCTAMAHMDSWFCSACQRGLGPEAGYPREQNREKRERGDLEVA